MSEIQSVNVNAIQYLISSLPATPPTTHGITDVSSTAGSNNYFPNETLQHLPTTSSNMGSTKETPKKQISTNFTSKSQPSKGGSEKELPQEIPPTIPPTTQTTTPQKTLHMTLDTQNGISGPKVEEYHTRTPLTTERSWFTQEVQLANFLEEKVFSHRK